MSSSRKIDIICIVALILTVAFTVLFMFGKKIGITGVVDEDAEGYEGTDYFTSNDQDEKVNMDFAVTVTLNKTSAKISGNGAYFNDGNLYISGGGVYEITGELTDGSIIVDAYNSSKVWLILNNADIYCSDDAAIRVDQADKVFIHLAEGSSNTLASGDTYSETAKADNTGGVIYSHDDLTIKGSGRLEITAAYKHGIDANDSLHITGGTISITSVADAIHVNEEFNYTGADLTIDAGDDGIHSDTQINILGGNIQINNCYEGLEAVTIYMADGELVVYPSDDGLNANGNRTGSFGGFGRMGRNSEAEEDSEQTETGDDEETYIRIDGGTITVINSAAMDADGFDSNGSIYINGGVIRISMTGSGSNCALDYGSESGGELVVTGGEIIACGSSSMAEEFGEGSTQVSILYNLSETVSEQSTFSVKNADGEVILSYDVPCSFNSVAISSSELEVGETYTFCFGDSEEEVSIASVTSMIGSGGRDGMNSGMGGDRKNSFEHSEENSSEDSSENDFGKRGGFGHRPSRDESDDEGSYDMPGDFRNRHERSSDFNPEEFGKLPSDFDPEAFGELPSDFDPEALGEMPSDHALEEPGEMPQGGPANQEEEDASEDETSSGMRITDLSVNERILLGSTLAALIAAILFAAFYRRKR